MSVKLWHDDVRSAPEGWVWARTNAEAKAILSSEVVTCISLDYDMGNHDLPPDTYDACPGSGMPGKGKENGCHLVEWMGENGRIPDRIRVHSWKSSYIVTALNKIGVTEVEVRSFQHGEKIT